jgi:SHS2 domain-containing protein
VYEILQHTADIRISLTAPTLEELFADALLALMEVIGGHPVSEEVVHETMRVDSVDRTALLVDFLNEALLRCHLRRQRYTAASISSLTETALVASLQAVLVADVHEDVKAVTYHEADVRRGADGQWMTMLVLDI